MNTYVNSLTQLAVATTAQPQGKSGNFFEALARAWGEALDKQAAVIQEKSDIVTGGNDTPGALTDLTAESAKIAFLANNSHTSTSEAAEALKAVAQK